MKYLIYILLFTHISCHAQTVEQMFDYYMSLPDRNYLDISEDMKSDIDSMVVNNIYGQSKKIYLEEFHNRVNQIKAIAIPNEGIKEEGAKIFHQLEGYEPFSCTAKDFVDKDPVRLNGVIGHSAHYDSIEFYINKCNSFIIKADVYEITYIIFIKGKLTDEDFQRIAHSMEVLSSNGEEMGKEYDVIYLDDL